MEAPDGSEELAQWNRDDLRAKAVIQLSITDEYLEMVRDCDTALNMWNTIKDVFQRATLLNPLHFRRKFYSAKMEHNERVLACISRIRQLASDLRSMNVEELEQDIAMTPLSGLPQRFENLIVAIDTLSDESNMSVEFVNSRLIQEEMRMLERDGQTVNSSDSALAHHQKSTYRNSRFCNYCKEIIIQSPTVGRNRVIDEGRVNQLTMRKVFCILWTMEKISHTS